MAKIASPSSTILDSGDIYRIRNDEKTVLNLTFERRKYSVQPGETALVPFSLICHFWGDPRSRFGKIEKFSDSKEKGFIDSREGVLRRLGGLYGTYSEDTTVLCAEEWEPNSPHAGTSKGRPHRVSIQTENGDVIIPVCFDTSGEAVYPAVRNESEDLNDLVQYREKLDRDMDKLKEQMRELQGLTTEDDATVDAPSAR